MGKHIKRGRKKRNKPYHHTVQKHKWAKSKKKKQTRITEYVIKFITDERMCPRWFLTLFTLRFSTAIASAWDHSKTVQSNMDDLGLIYDLNKAISLNASNSSSMISKKAVKRASKSGVLRGA